MVNGAMTETLAASWGEQSLSASTFSHTSRQQSSHLVRAYRQASELFLTRRLSEALQVLEPVVKPEPADSPNRSSNGYPQRPPVAAASRNTRIKIWSLYLTLLNTIIELGPEEGKQVFGSSRWKALATSAREGSVWEVVVQNGYGGAEGEVDAEVIVNLATLLLAHSPSQFYTQTRLETYLSISSQAPPSDELNYNAQSAGDVHRSIQGSYSNGTSTPRDLKARLMVLELFALHVLPRNEDWDYASAFIQNNEVLDEERRETLLLALHELRDEKDKDAAREEELKKEQEEQSERARREREEEAQRARRRAEEEEARKRKQEHARRPVSKEPETHDEVDHKSSRAGPVHGQQNDSSKGSHSSSSASGRPAKKGTHTPPRLYKRASVAIAAFNNAILQALKSISGNRMVLFRMLLFLLAFVMAFGRRHIRQRLRLLLETAWDKLRGTVGMGVKVSYI